MAGIVSHVTLLEFAAELRADEVLLRKLRSLNNVTIHTSAQTIEVKGDGNKVNGIDFKDTINYYLSGWQIPTIRKTRV